MSQTAAVTSFARWLFGRKQTWILAGALATMFGVWLVVTSPEEAPQVAGMGMGPLLYYLQWVIYGLIILLLAIRIAHYRRTLSPRQDIGFVFVITALYTVGFALHYTPFVYHFPEGPFVGIVRAVVMFGCGVLGAVYGLSSTHRWY